MSELKKTIKINPELFNMKSDKTRKNTGEKKPKTYQPLVINESSLKKQFLNRIKEHKIKENMSNTKASLENSFNDEFMDSISYLSTLSQKHKTNSDKVKYEEKKQRQVQQPTPTQQHNFTVKNHERPLIPHVELELPVELREPVVFTPPVTTSPLQLNNQSVPYGCLKGGTKPTFRNWQKMTRRNVETYQQPATFESAPTPSPTPQVSASSSASQIQPSTNPMDKLPIYKEMSEREKKLEMLKIKMKQQQDLLVQERMRRQQLEEELKNREILENQMKNKLLATTKSSIETEIKVNDSAIHSGGDLSQPTNTNSNPNPKIFIKKTIRRKYTLGKSKIRKTVGILIKDKNTRKRVLQAQKDIKKKPIHEVKQYLKEHGLLKIGSNAPNDVIRKTFECAMLTGDVINLNKDVLIHNLLNEPDSSH